MKRYKNSYLSTETQQSAPDACGKRINVNEPYDIVRVFSSIHDTAVPANSISCISSFATAPDNSLITLLSQSQKMMSIIIHSYASQGYLQ